MSEWLPIESAPKDGARIVAYDALTDAAHVTWWDGHGWHDPDDHYYSEAPDFAPTLWVPFSAPLTITPDEAAK